MRKQLLAVAIISWLSKSCYCQTAPTADSLAAMLKTSQYRSQLEMEGNESFHLVASLEAFDQSGKSLEKGSLDELWRSPHEYRKQLTLGSGTLLKVSSELKVWRTGQWTMREAISLATDAVLQPFFMKPLIEGRLSDATSSRNDASVECVGVEPVLPGVGEETRLALTTYCMDKGSHLIRSVSRPNSIEIVFNDYQLFGKRYIARSIQVGIRGKTVLRMHVDVLEPANDFRALDVPMPTGAQDLSAVKPEPDAPYITGELMHGQLLKKVRPAYSQALFPGVAVVKLHINTHGSVESAEILRCDSPVLKAPIISAVKQWNYRVSYRGHNVVADEQIITLPSVEDDAP